MVRRCCATDLEGRCEEVPAGFRQRQAAEERGAIR